MGQGSGTLVFRALRVMLLGCQSGSVGLSDILYPESSIQVSLFKIIALLYLHLSPEQHEPLSVELVHRGGEL